MHEQEIQKLVDEHEAKMGEYVQTVQEWHEGEMQGLRDQHALELHQLSSGEG